MKALDPILTLIAQQANVKTCHVWHTYSAMCELGKAFNAEAFALFCGLQRYHVEKIMESLQANSCMPEDGGKARGARKKSTTAASRLQPDWTPPEEWLTLAINEKHWTRSEALAEAMSMHDWALAKGEAKIDWLAAWRGWFRRSKRPEGQAPRQSSAMSRADTLRMQIKGNRAAGRDMVADQLQAELDGLESNVVPIRVNGK